MSNTIAIIDYGMGNLRSVQKAFEKIGVSAIVTSDPKELDSAGKIVFPGVGAFQDAMDELQKMNLLQSIVNNIEKGKLFLGICLGLQLLFSKSFEDGEHEGLGIINGDVIRFNNNLNTSGDNEKLKIPHMGWNVVNFEDSASPLFENVSNNSYMYFVHSYYVSPDNNDVVIGKTDYGIDFPSVVCKDNVYATQFHPEKSQDAGLQILKNFSKLN